MSSHECADLPRGRATAIDCMEATSSRAGYLPLPLAHISVSVLTEVAVYLKARPDQDESTDTGAYSLYAGPSVPFTETDRQRLLDHGIRFVYVRICDQIRVQREIEARLSAIAADPSTPSEEASRIIYETSFELVNEVLSEPQLKGLGAPLGHVCRAVSTFVIRHQDAFLHLFATSRHDFYTATHMVNVATWMVPIAYQLGYRDEQQLAEIGQAGLLHDIGKVRVASTILNKVKSLTADERLQVRQHALFGRDLAHAARSLPQMVAIVAGQHHERMDGSGYPDGLIGEEIHPVSRICAVVDSFDAMTALRPFKDRALTVAEAIAIIQADTPARYDADVVAAWLSLITPQMGATAGQPRSLTEHRAYARYDFCCPARLCVRMPGHDDPPEEIEINAMTRNLSRAGIALICKLPIPVGERVRVVLKKKTAAREQFSGTVTRCSHLSDGTYEIGVSFAMDSVHLIQTRAGADDR